jgi:hypothetical protein
VTPVFISGTCDDTEVSSGQTAEEIHFYRPFDVVRLVFSTLKILYMCFVPCPKCGRADSEPGIYYACVVLFRAFL